MPHTRRVLRSDLANLAPDGTGDVAGDELVLVPLQRLAVAHLAVVLDRLHLRAPALSDPRSQCTCSAPRLTSERKERESENRRASAKRERRGIHKTCAGKERHWHRNSRSDRRRSSRLGSMGPEANRAQLLDEFEALRLGLEHV
eukprot:3660797-Rhodomonas_salina.1